MATDSLTIASVMLSLSAAGLIFYILRLRQRRRASQSEDVEYSGRAKNPERLMVPDDEALDELDRLLENTLVSDE